MKKIVKGNDFTLRIPVAKMVEGQAEAYPLPACTDVVVQVCNQFKRIPLAFEIDVKEDNVLLARVEGDKMSLGTYAIEVNGFMLNGVLIPWSKDDPSSPNVDKRMGLRQNIADKIALGEENISIWLKGMSFTMPCAQAEVLMRSIENYAYECFNVTASHKAAVGELKSIEEVEAYDYKAGYPKMLEMSV